ncbi:MAG: gliding motility-associated C-terminal domain-containing protein, partial [Bacteroidota bacterium]|nr:gliding motility-associated C-terminal domain-containing protein [Bacteroidota bacterium]
INGGTSPYDFNWSTGDKTEDISQLSAGIYEILVMDNKDCKIEESIEVSQFSQIMIDYEISEISCNDQSDGSILLNVSGGAENYKFLWSTGDTTQNIFNKVSGIYSIEITDNNNCKVQIDNLKINFNESNCINIPSSFTPNGDGTNDTWILRNVDLYPTAVIKVFNRWGNEIYQSNGYKIPWDGNFKGKKLPSGTYFYVIELNNGEKPYTGTVTIVK